MHVLPTSDFEGRGLPGDASCFLKLSKSMAIDVTLLEVLFRSYLENSVEWLQQNLTHQNIGRIKLPL